MITILTDENTQKIGLAVYNSFARTRGDVRFICLENMTVKPCYACRGCEQKTYLRCIVRDDADLILPYLAQSSVMIVVTWITYGSYSFQTKRALDKIGLLCDMHYYCKNGELVKGLNRAGTAFYAVGVHDGAEKAEIQAFEQLVTENLTITGWKGKPFTTMAIGFDPSRLLKEVSEL